MSVKVKSASTPTSKQLQSQQPYPKPSSFAHYVSHLMTPINEKELNNLIKQTFILMEDFNSHNLIYVTKTTNKRGKTLEKKSSIATIYAYTVRNLRLRLDSSSVTLSAIDLFLSDPSIFRDYNWRIY